jgi:hypothetical protein
VPSTAFSSFFKKFGVNHGKSSSLHQSKKESSGIEMGKGNGKAAASREKT